MDNAQVTARDGSWFLFADWQGVTRIGLPGDRVKTDANLNRPYQHKPLVLRPSGLVWSAYAVDIDPVTLKKVRPAQPGHESPDPLGGADIAVSDEAVTVNGSSLALAASGAELDLGGREERRERYGDTAYDVSPDGAVVAFGRSAGRTHAALVLRAADGSGRVAWCRPVARPPYGAPNAVRAGDATFLTDRDGVADVAYLVEIGDDGAVRSEQHTAAVAGPWVHEGAVWWQPDEATLCEGPRLGEVARSYALPAEHAGPGRLLRLAGRRLFVPWSGVTMLDLAPAKKDRGEISRKHKADDEAMYREAERLLRPIAAGMARRGARVTWRGCTRSGKRREPLAAIAGQSDIVSYLVGYVLQDGARAKLSSLGVTSVGFFGGGAFDDILAPVAATTADDIHDLVAMMDAAGLSRASGIPYLHTLEERAAERGKALPLTPEAEEAALAAVLSGLCSVSSGPPAPASAASFAAAASSLRDDNRLRAAGIRDSYTALFLAVHGHRRFGAEAVAPVREALLAMSSAFAANLEKALAWPAPPYPR